MLEQKLHFLIFFLVKILVAKEATEQDQIRRQKTHREILRTHILQIVLPVVLSTQDIHPRTCQLLRLLLRDPQQSRHCLQIRKESLR